MKVWGGQPMFKMKRKSFACIELTDYCIRAIVSKNQSLKDLEVLEIPLPPNIVQNGTIIDEMALYELLKGHVQKLGGKNQPIRFFVPDPSVLLKQFDYPDDLEMTNLKSYVEMELGNSIHLPFKDPLLDVYDAWEGDGKAVIFAAPSEEVNKVINLFTDLGMIPEVAEIRALSNLKMLDELQLLKKDKTYLITDWSINNVMISIYSNREVEFLRYQPIETKLTQWENTTHENGEIEFSYTGDLSQYEETLRNEATELERVMNFFKFSLHKGDKEIDELIVLGDNPMLHYVHSILQQYFSLPTHVLKDDALQADFPDFKVKHTGLLGLAIKEVDL